MAEPVLLICGIPGSGKSTFGHWLEEQRGFVHVDMESGALEGRGLQSSWDEFIDDPSSRGFWQLLLQFSRPVVLDWWFPVICLPLVDALRRQGVRLWWFTGDRLFARANFQKAKGPDPRPFDCQYADISAHWSAISGVFADRIIRAVRQDGSCMTGDEIYQEILNKSDVAA